MSEWRPIETAPRDGTVLLLWCESFAVVGKYWRQETPAWEGWVEIYEEDDLPDPTHWQPLPPPPKE